MQWINKLKISYKLAILIVMAILFVITVGVTGYYFNNKACNDMTTMYNDRLLPVKWLNEANSIAISNKLIVLEVISASSDNKQSDVNQYIEDIKVNAEKYNKLMGEYEKTKLDSFETKTLSDLKDKLVSYREVRSKVFELALAGKAAEAKILFNQNINNYDAILKNSKELADYNAKVASDINTQNDKDAVTANITIFSVILGAAALMLFLGLMISGMITKPIAKAVQNLEESAGQVASASEQLSSSSQQLAEGGAEQAASIEETSSTLEESASMIRQNSENTRQAALLAKKTKESADKGNKEMKDMMTSMGELKKSSDEIAKIIKVIDDIAFQTNILALNAAVEAARAGEAGMGFAVVAEEVRNLAQRSAQAAKDTASIIESNIELSEKGVDVSGKVNESLVDIFNESQKVNELIDEIAAASQEQAQGIAQINKAISQMEQVVQGNAATAEESAASSEELTSQAVNMQDIVNSLVQLVNGVQTELNQSSYKVLSNKVNQKK